MLAMAPAMVIASGLSLLFNWPWALEPLAEKVMLATPVDIAQQLILRLGPAARPLALLGGFAVSLVLGGLVGAVTAIPHGRLPACLPPVAALLLLCATLFIVFPPLDPVPPAVLIALYSAVLAWRHITAYRGPRAEPAGRKRPRRAVISDGIRIIRAATVLTGLLLVEPWYKSRTVLTRGGKTSGFSAPRPRRHGFDIPGITPEVTAVDNFYYLTKNLVDPDLGDESWSLRVDGLVKRPYVYTFDTLLALPSTSQYVTQECVSNPVGGPLMSCAQFTGVPLRALLSAAGPLTPDAEVVMRSADGLADSIPLELALDPAVLVAYGMNGQYLDRRHGYPARMLIPGSYGFKSIKWVEHVELVDHTFKGSWQELGWTESAVVHTTARIDLARRTAGGTLVAGIAFAGKRGIRRVQVRAGSGPWIDAALDVPALSQFAWVQWRLVLPSRGHLTLEARAYDGTGVAQAQRDSDVYPAGATGYHRIVVDV